MNTDSTSDATLEDLSDRIGRIAVEDMIARGEACRRQFQLAGYEAIDRAVWMTLDAVRDFFDADDVAAFVDGLRTSVAKYEEHDEGAWAP